MNVIAAKFKPQPSTNIYYYCVVYVSAGHLGTREPAFNKINCLESHIGLCKHKDTCPAFYLVQIHRLKTAMCISVASAAHNSRATVNVTHTWVHILPGVRQQHPFS